MNNLKIVYSAKKIIFMRNTVFIITKLLHDVFAADPSQLYGRRDGHKRFQRKMSRHRTHHATAIVGSKKPQTIYLKNRFSMVSLLFFCYKSIQEKKLFNDFKFEQLLLKKHKLLMK